MTREQKYAEQMKELGIYEEIFEPEIHTLAVLERDLQRLTKRWKDEGCQTFDDTGRGPVTSDKTLDAIMSIRREILAHRDALGLTPKALVRLKGRPVAEADDQADGKPAELTILDEVRSKYA